MANVALSVLMDTFLQEGVLDSTQKDSIREDLGLKTTDAVTFKNLVLSGLSLAGSASTSTLSLASTWNTSGTVTAILLDVTDTASNAASLLMDLKVGGTSKLSLSKAGLLTVPSLAIGSGVGSTFEPRYGNGVDIGNIAAFDGGTGGHLAFWLHSAAKILWDGSGAPSSNGSKSALFSPAPAQYQFGLDHATTPTTQTIKSHNVTTGYGSNLNISAGSGSSGKGILTLDGSNRTQASSFNVGELYSTLFNFGILTPPLNGLAELVSPTSGEIYIAFNSGNFESILWAIIVQYSTDESSWSETSVLENGDGMSPSLNINGLEPEVTYYIRWRSRAYFNPNVFTDWSSTQSITTSL